MKHIRIAVLAYDGCMPTQLFGIADVLRIAGELDAGLGNKKGVSLDVELVAVQGRKIRLAGGLSVEVKRATGHHDLLIIPGFETSRFEQDWKTRLPRLAREIQFIQHSFSRGTTVAAVCVGAFILGEAGLLNGRKVTTAWMFSADLALHYPEARLSPESILLDDGAIITTAAVSSAFDLAIYFVKQYLGAEVATATAAVTLLPSPRESQSPYIDSRLLKVDRPIFSQNLIQWFETRLVEDFDLEKVAAAFHVSARTLMRRVKAETGKSPLTLLQEVRVDKSKELLRSTNLSLLQIVEAVGYSDAASFTRLFSKIVGETPARFRQRRSSGPEISPDT